MIVILCVDPLFILASGTPENHLASAVLTKYFIVILFWRAHAIFSDENSDSLAEVRNAVELLEGMPLGNTVTVDSDST